MQQMDDDFKAQWYLLAPGAPIDDAEGPLSIRDIDVKFRTKEIHSSYLAWREDMPEWQKIYQINELKDKVMESANEMLDSVVEEYVKKFGKKDKQNDQDEDEQNNNAELKPHRQSKFSKDPNQYDDDDQEGDGNDESGLFYYSKEDKQYKIFDPTTRLWTSQSHKPDPATIENLKRINEEVKKDQQDLAKKIHEIAGDTDKQIHDQQLKDIVDNVTNDVLNQMAQDGAGVSNMSADDKQASTDQQSLADPVKTMTAEELKAKELKKLKKKRYLENKKRKWYQTKVNTFIYIQGLPNDVTHEDLKEYFVRCGVIRLDPNTGLEMIRIYRDDEGVPKGDARIGYAMVESVDMAIDMLNDTEFKPGYKISVQMAEFQQKGDQYIPRKIQKIDPLEKLRIKAEQERQLGWDDDMHIHEIGLKIVILEGMFTQEEVEAAVQSGREEQFFQELEQDVRFEIEQNIGAIDKMHVFRENPAGAIKIRFFSAVNAEECIKAMNGRFFDMRQIKCYFWDGKTDFRVIRETQEDFGKRVDEFGAWLEQQDLPEEVEQEQAQSHSQNDGSNNDKNDAENDGTKARSGLVD
eukprot:403337435